MGWPEPHHIRAAIKRAEAEEWAIKPTADGGYSLITPEGMFLVGLNGAIVQRAKPRGPNRAERRRAKKKARREARMMSQEERIKLLSGDWSPWEGP